MATRVNTRFVVLLSLGLVVLVLGLAGFYHVFVRQDPQQLKVRGDQLMEQGRIAAAAGKYEMALARRQHDPALMLAAVEAWRRLPVDDRLQARDTWGKIREYTRRAAELRPEDSELAERYFQLLHWQVRALDRSPAAYNALYNEADDKLSTLADDATEAAAVAHKYRGVAGVHRLDETAGEDQQQAVRRDLEIALESRPDDAAAAYHLARYHLTRAGLLERRSAADQQIRSHRQKALDVSGRMLEPAPEAPDRLLKRARILLHPQLARADQARPVAGQLLTRLLERPEPSHLVLQAVDLLGRFRALGSPVPTPEGEASDEASAVAVLRRATEAHPERAVYWAALGRALRRAGRTEPATEAYRRAREVGEEGPARQVLRDRGLQRRAMRELADLWLIELRQLGVSQKREAQLDRVAGLLEELANRQGEGDPRLRMLRGRLALHEGRLSEAGRLLDEAADTLAEPARARIMAAEAYLRQGQWGAAANRLEALSQRHRQAIPLRLRLARIYLQGERFEKAEKHLQVVLDRRPDHAEARMLKGRLLGARRQVEQAISVFQGLDRDRHPEAIKPLAKLQLLSGRPSPARDLLRQHLEREPNDQDALRLYVSLLDEEEAQLAALEDLAEQGTADQRIEVLRAAVQASGESVQQQTALRDQLLEKAIERQQDPAVRGMMRAREALRNDEPRLAREALVRAAEQAPENARLLKMQFELALEAEAWERAAGLVDRAREIDADEAGGRFYGGRLALARGEVDEAVARLKRAVAARPVYSRGQRWLGDALRQRGDLESAAEAYRKAVKQRPDHAAALRRLTAVQIRLGNAEQALEHLREARRYEPTPELIRQQARLERQVGEPARALELRRRLADRDPADLVNQQAIVQLLVELDRPDQAVDHAQQVVEAQGAERRAIAALATAQRAAGELQAGLETIRSYLADRGDEATARDYLVLARYYLQAGRSQQALESYREAIGRESPDEAVATHELAQWMFAHNLAERAARLYRRLYQAEPDDRQMAGYRWAEALVRSDKLEQAEEVLAELDAAAPTGRALRGLIAERRDQPEAAMAHYAAAVEAGAEQPMVFYLRGRLHARQGDRPDQARADLRRALEVAPQLHAARMTLARHHLRQGEPDRARQALNNVLSRQPAHPRARLQMAALEERRGNVSRARSLLEEAAEMLPGSSRWPRRLARLTQRQEGPAAAVSHWREAVEREPAPANLAGLGETLLASNEAPAALELAGTYEGIFSHDARLQGLKAAALAREGDREAAIETFDEALQRAAAPAEVFPLAARLRRLLGHETAVDRLEARQETVGQVAAALAISELEKQRGEPAAALDRLSQIDEAKVTEANVAGRFHRLKGNCHQRLDQHEQARQAYETALAQAESEDLELLNNLAYLLAEHAQEPDRAVELAERAAELAPDNAQVLDTLGWARFRAGNVLEARQTLQRSVAVEPQALNQLHLGRVLMELEVSGQARRLFDRALELAREAEKHRITEQAEQWLSELAPQKAGA